MPEGPTGVATYRAAVGRLVQAAGSVEDWVQPSRCDGWTCADLAGHVLCVVRWHHEWLDRAEAGDLSLPWPAAELSRRNADALARLELTEPAARVATFVESASAYAERVAARWDLPFSYPGGVLTAGTHALLAAGEWALHAWDLDEAPLAANPAEAVRAAWLGLGRTVSADGDAWSALLRASGRESN